MLHTPPVSVVIVAGGKGLRMGNALPKQFLPLQGFPVLYYSIRTFQLAFPDAKLILVLPEEHFSYCNSLLLAFNPPIEPAIVAGGDTRHHSVKNGLREVLPNSIVFVHDGVRPFISTAWLHEAYRQAITTGSAIPVLPVTDSIRHVDMAAHHSQAMDRSRLYSVQTPQAFRADMLLAAFNQDYNEQFTDEATVVEHAGHEVNLIPGLRQNIKLTTPEDLLWAEAMLREQLVTT